MKPSKSQQQWKDHTIGIYSHIDFDAQFPDVAEFSLELEELDYGMPIGIKITLTNDYLEPVFCHNQSCESGYYDWLHMLRGAVHNREMHKEISHAHCSGNMGGKHTKSCSRSFVGTLIVRYKEMQESEIVSS